ncbi:MAG: hypothetical protein CYPHOPRED_002114 [Cyphobasidiales sp. Tagirdzhanova-0007]|nr:MAG: hypothetical protein CYPHOPRED_002114 [Cyphobasidiales sp. Tagirdzhanova-0007]
MHNRAYCFEQGESLEDVHVRAGEVVERCVVPWLVRGARSTGEREGGREEHVVLVAHGIMLSEMLFALSRLADPRAPYARQSGHTNTGWTRLVLSLPPHAASSLPEPLIPPLTSPDLPPPLPLNDLFTSTSTSTTTLPRPSLRTTHTNITTHLSGLKRTKGGVGSEAFDARQKSLRDFFSGAGVGEADGDEEGTPVHSLGSSSSPSSSAAAARKVPDLPVGDMVADEVDERGGTESKRGIRVKSPPSPSPTKKSKLT